MKDSKGHGSNPRGGTQAALAQRAKMTRGADTVMREHEKFTAGANREVLRALSGAAHQSLIGKLGTGIKTFAKDTSGSGSDDNGMLGLTGFPDVYELGHKAVERYGHEYGPVLHKYGDALHHLVSQGKHFFG